MFTSDLHGRRSRYRKLVDAALAERPQVVLVGGDLLPFDRRWTGGSFVDEVLRTEFARLATGLGDSAPRVLLILGNDDPRDREPELLAGEEEGLWTYLNLRSTEVGGYRFTGYCFVPPTPFLLKDWERYDVSRHLDPGCVSPEDGQRTVPVTDGQALDRTIADDLDELAGEDDLSRRVFLFHSPPYRSNLDRAALDGKFIDHVPLDVNVGSMAISRFIRDRQPMLTLHGHIHESTRITGSWRDRIGRTHSFNGAHDGPELALIRFDLGDLDSATRELL
jgi:Icc-related predicted phosphoesterase